MSARSVVRAAVWTISCHVVDVPGIPIRREMMARTMYAILEVESEEWWLNGSWSNQLLHIQGKCGEIGLPQLTYAMFLDAHDTWERSKEQAPHLMPRMDTLEGQLLAMLWYWSGYYDASHIDQEELTGSDVPLLELLAAIHHCGPGGVGPDRERYLAVFRVTLKKQGHEVFDGERPKENS